MIRHPRNTHGLSLVELLVVLGIVLLLIGLLMPFLSRARHSTLQTVCSSNLRQIGIGLGQYREMHNGFLPVAQTFPADPIKPVVMDALDVHLGHERDVWHCPADSELFETFGTSYEYMVGFYLIQAAMENPNMPTQAQRRFIKSLENDPALAFVLLDADAFHPGGHETSQRNVLFLDGHVDWFHVP